jgi:hypothetical protein
MGQKFLRLETSATSPASFLLSQPEVTILVDNLYDFPELEAVFDQYAGLESCTSFEVRAFDRGEDDPPTVDGYMSDHDWLSISASELRPYLAVRGQYPKGHWSSWYYSYRGGMIFVPEKF